MGENLPKYLVDPKGYCSRINTLIKQNSIEWQTVWMAAIPELCNLTPNEISVINPLLKPIENAFKSKDTNLRVQAFECWSHFIPLCDKIQVSDKLWNLLLVPLLAHNHSAFVVLEAKLKTWDTFVDTAFITKPNTMIKAVPHLLKCLYVPHNSSDPACKFDELVEFCGQLYLKIMKKCSSFDDEIYNILSYLEKAIPPLSNFEHTQKLAQSIWNEALEIITRSGWLTDHFKFLMRTLENLFSDSENRGLQLISIFLCLLLDIHNSFPPDRLTPHLNLIIRCLFHPSMSVKVTCNSMNSMLKLCERPSFYFHELDKLLTERIKIDKTNVDVLWIALASSFTKWVKNNTICENDVSNQEFITALRILLFPFDHIHEISYETERFNSVMKQWKLCYEECAKSAGSEKFIKILLEKLESGIDSNITRLIVATFICNTMLTIVRFSDEFVHMKSVLLKISKNMPDMKKLMDSKLKSFAIKYIVTVKAYVEFQKSCWEDFSYVIKNFSPLLPKDGNEILSEVNVSKIDVSINSSSKQVNEGNNCNTVTTPKRSSFLGRVNRLSSPATPSARLPTTPKTLTTDDDDVEVVEVKPKPKNSPMTQHQIESAKNKHYIPALYQDLSQSQSQSLSQFESESSIPVNMKPNNSVNPEIFEENANLPANSGGSSVIPAVSLSFKSGLNSPITVVNRKLSSFSKSLFNDKKKSSRENSDSDSSVEVIAERELSNKEKNNYGVDSATSNGCKVLDKSTTKRKTVEHETLNETPSKRSKGPLNKVINDADDKCSLQSGQPVNVISSVRKSKEKFRLNNEKSTNETSDEPQVINLEEADSQNIFVPSNSADNKSASSPLNSLMNLRKRSLRVRKSLDSTKLTSSDDSGNDTEFPQRNENPKKRKSREISTVNIVVNRVHQTRQSECTENSFVKLVSHEIPLQHRITEKTPVMEKKTSKIVAFPPEKSSTDSLILVEREVPEVISIEDSESVNMEKKADEDKTIDRFENVSVLKENSSDESTFFEGSDQNAANKTHNNPETSAKEQIPDDNLVTTNLNNAKISTSISPEVISSVDCKSAEKNDDIPDVCPNQCAVEPNTTGENLCNSTSVLESPDASVRNESTIDIHSSDKEKNSKDEIVVSKMTPIDTSAAVTEPSKENLKISSVESSLPSKNNNEQLKYEKSNADRGEKREAIDHNTSTPNSSRGKHMLKVLGVNKISEPTKQASTPQTVSSPISQRTKMIMNTKYPFPYTPKECTSPGILKKPDANQNNFSPKSPKIVNFADNLTHVRFFVDHDESDMDSLISTGDKLSGENVLNNEQLRSQDMLYSPLHTCRDNIQHVLELIFGSAGSKQAFDHFERIGVRTVGQLASMSTLTASSIPAGDGRVRRLRRALEKYERHIESQGRRKPSPRRRILNTPREIGDVIHLFDEEKPADNGSTSDEETETPAENEESNLSKEITAEHAMATESKESSVDKESNIVNGFPEAVEPTADKSISNEDSGTLDQEATAVSNNEHILNSKHTDSVIEVIEDSNGVESGRSAENEVLKETEDKENVDPRSEVMDTEIAHEACIVPDHEAEPMEVDDQPCNTPKTSNENINESTDFVCTDTNSNTCQQDISDRRSITMSKLNRLSLVFDSNNKENLNEIAAPISEISMKTVVVVNENDNSTNESISILAESKITTHAEKITESQETLLDLPEISHSVVESVIVSPSDDQNQDTNIAKKQIETNFEEKNPNDIDPNSKNNKKKFQKNENESTFERRDENLSSENIFPVHQNNENLTEKMTTNIYNDHEIASVEFNQTNIEQDSVNNQNGLIEDKDTQNFEGCSGFWVDAVKQHMFPHFNGSDAAAREVVLTVVEGLHSILSLNGLELKLKIIEKEKK